MIGLHTSSSTQDINNTESSPNKPLFTIEEENLLREQVKKLVNENGLSIEGFSLYQQIAGKFPGRNFQTLRSHYLDNLRNPSEQPKIGVGEEREEEGDFYTLKPSTTTTTTTITTTTTPQEEISQIVVNKRQSRAALPQSSPTTSKKSKNKIEIKGEKSKDPFAPEIKKPSLKSEPLSSISVEFINSAVSLLTKMTDQPEEVIIHALYITSGDILAAFRFLTREIHASWNYEEDIAILCRDAEKVVKLLERKSTDEIANRFEFLNSLCDAP